MLSLWSQAGSEINNGTLFSRLSIVKFKIHERWEVEEVRSQRKYLINGAHNDNLDEKIEGSLGKL